MTTPVNNNSDVNPLLYVDLSDDSTDSTVLDPIGKAQQAQSEALTKAAEADDEVSRKSASRALKNRNNFI